MTNDKKWIVVWAVLISMSVIIMLLHRATMASTMEVMIELSRHTPFTEKSFEDMFYNSVLRNSDHGNGLDKCYINNSIAEENIRGVSFVASVCIKEVDISEHRVDIYFKENSREFCYRLTIRGFKSWMMCVSPESTFKMFTEISNICMQYSPVRQSQFVVV